MISNTSRVLFTVMLNHKQGTPCIALIGTRNVLNGYSLASFHCRNVHNRVRIYYKGNISYETPMQNYLTLIGGNL